MVTAVNDDDDDDDGHGWCGKSGHHAGAALDALWRDERNLNLPVFLSLTIIRRRALMNL